MANVVEIKRFAVHDGDGIRTTVFLKGCPINCVWCHNPECIDFNTQIAYYSNKCIACGCCVAVCPNGAHKMIDGNHVFERTLCSGCGKCELPCSGEAIKIYGRDMTVEELLQILLKDKDFYEMSGGGVTISGGECLMYPEFCSELLKRLKENDIHTAIDTCGFVSKKSIDMVIPYTDIFLYDLKAYDESVHIRCTGKSNKIILENLKYIDECGKKIEIRIPYVPEFNDDQIEKIANFVSTLKNVTKVRVLPYHNYAGSKYESLEMKNNLPKKLPTDFMIKQAENILDMKLKVKNENTSSDIKHELYLTDQSQLNVDNIRIQEIIAYINDNLTEPLSVSKISEKFFISKEYLCTCFKKNTGETLFSYIRKLRLNYAVYLLENTEKKVIEVCELSGFNSLSTFLTNFKREFGITPLQMRNKKKKNVEF